jgi:ParB family transcriptional regulator, chromosome partitioning protein
MTMPTAQRIEMIALDSITVLNPRTRNRKQHQEIIENIRIIGLKKPITVSLRHDRDGIAHYDLVCGQGRLEAFRALGQTEIPAIVTQDEPEECLLKSLVENIARRQHSPIEQLQEIGRLRQRGHTEPAIAEMLGVSSSWVNMITRLLDHGEQRLLRGVESGLIPLSLAVDIAKASETEIQDLLTDAYTSGTFRGKKLGAVRRLLEQRYKERKRETVGNSLPKRSYRRPQIDDLRRLYETEAEKHRILIKKADFVQQRLLFIVGALKDLFSEDDEFAQLLESENLRTLPKQLDLRIGWRTP